MKPVRLYGFRHDHGSYGQVTDGFRRGLITLGYEVDSESMTLDTVALDADQTFDEEPTGLPLAEVALFTGPPAMCPRMVQGTDHKVRCVMVAPNSSKLPDRTMHAVNAHATHVLTPSVWGKTVVEKYTEHPVIVVPHGVSGMFGAGWINLPHSTMMDRYNAGEFTVLHLSSTDSERKGTLELCVAFTEAVKQGWLPPRAELRLVLTPTGKGRLMDEGVLTRSMILTNRVVFGLAPEAMSLEYAKAHLVCQPSRGEGFGMVPLEALACGTPIAATRATGHAEWFYGLGGAIEIATGPEAPIDDMPGATAPSVASADIAVALRQAYAEWQHLKMLAMGQAFALKTKRGWGVALGPLRQILDV